MTDLQHLPQGGQATAAWAKPPRTRAQRRTDVLTKLHSDDKLWIATASDDGSAHLVPFSFVWDGQRVTMATSATNPAAKNAARTGKARLALGNYGDVVLIDGTVDVVQPSDIDDGVADRLARASAIDGRRAPGFVYLQLEPTRIQAWWSGRELGSPTIMRDGQWLS
jgi:Pyridoxamine 5'-phosphate oxidase